MPIPPTTCVACGGGGSMLIDTDVLIWVLRGNLKAAKRVDAVEDRAVSIVSYMELLQGARDKAEVRTIKRYLADLAFTVIPLSENIGHRASIYMEQHAVASSLSMADALIAAAATESNHALLTGNDKHFKPVTELEVKRFRP